MKLGFVTAILPDLELREVLEFAASEDYDCVEVMCWPVGGRDRKFGGVTHIDAAELTQSKADEIRGWCDELDVEISGLGYYPNPLSGDEEESSTAFAHLRRVIDAAGLLGLKNVNTFIGNDHERDVEYNLGRFAQRWPEMIRYAEERDILIGIENCPMLFAPDQWPGGKNLARTPALWRQMFETIPSAHFGLNYDPSHLVMLMMDYVAPIYDFQKRIFHAHAKDMRIDRARLNENSILSFDYFTPKVPGLGDVDWGAWVSALTDVGYDGAVCVEVEDEAFMADLESRKNSLRLSRNVLRPLIV